MPRDPYADRHLDGRLAAVITILLTVAVVGGIALLAGWQARTAAFLLAGFSLGSGVLFHLVPSFGMEGMEAQGQMISFMKNVTIAGGMLMVVAFGPGAVSVAQGKAVPAE